jgi:uncharacterized protein YndB with AHSA1/START domain
VTTAHGTFETIDGRPALHFERRLRHPAERVWRAITEPDGLDQWFPHAGDRVVVESEAPRRLVCRWFDNELRFELTPDGDGTVLRLVALLSEREAAARDMAGWHVCLDRLEQALDTGEAEAPGPDATPEWSALFDDYVAAGVPEGAPIPGRD